MSITRPSTTKTHTTEWWAGVRGPRCEYGRQISGEGGKEVDRLSGVRKEGGRLEGGRIHGPSSDCADCSEVGVQRTCGRYGAAGTRRGRSEGVIEGEPGDGIPDSDSPTHTD